MRTIELIKNFKYTRYMPLVYLKNPDPQEVTGQRNLGRFMRILLVKRLESSFYAFKMTLDRFIHSYEAFIKMLDKGTIYISKKHSGKIYEALENDDIDRIMELVEQDKVQKYESGDFSKSFRENLKDDLDILLEMKKLWDGVQADPKLDQFKSILNKDKILKENKLIIFTESKETAEYLDKNLRKEFGSQVLSFSSKSSAAVRETIIDNYDPKHKNQKDDIRILITTDILAEGVNLHRSNVVINHDIPWNPTRVLQRVGRVNRVDTKFDDIYVYNFFPSVQGNNEIKLEEAAIAKIQAFHDTLGEDSQYLTEGEEITSHELFNRLNSKKILEEGGELEEDSELQYLSEIRDIRDNNIALYEKIKRLPKKARSAKVYPDSKEAVVTFFKKGKLRKIYIADVKEAKELDFFNAAVILKSKNTDKRERLSPDFYKLLAQNKEQFKLATTEEAREFKQEGGRSNEITLARTIKAIKKFSGFTDEDEGYLERVSKALDEGALPKQTTKTLVKEIKKENNPLKILFKFKQGIPQNFFAEGFVDNPYYNTAPREVILSEYLI